MPDLLSMFYNWDKGSFFNKISETIPWMDETVAFMYFGRSGRKTASPILRHLWEHTSTDIELEEKVAAMLLNRFSTAWIKARSALEVEFDPIKSYEYTETYTPNLKRVIGKEATDTGKITDVSTDTPNITTTNEESVYAFNSDEPQPSRKTATLENGTSTFNSTKDNSVTSNSTVTEDETGESVTHKDGTTWVHTRQRLLKEEMELREYDLFEKIFKDIDKVLTSPKYNMRY